MKAPLRDFLVIRLERSRRADLRAAAEALGCPMAELVRRGLRSELLTALAPLPGVGADDGSGGGSRAPRRKGGGERFSRPSFVRPPRFRGAAGPRFRARGGAAGEPTRNTAARTLELRGERRWTIGFTVGGRIRRWTKKRYYARPCALFAVPTRRPR